MNHVLFMEMHMNKQHDNQHSLRELAFKFSGKNLYFIEFQLDPDKNAWVATFKRRFDIC